MRQEILRATWILTLSIIINSAYSQEVVVADAFDHTPVEHVFISADGKNFITTDEKGKADLSRLGEPHSLIKFQHSGFRSYEVLKSELRKNEVNIILLEVSNVSISEVTISATKWEQESSSLPVQVQVLDRQLVAFQNPQTAADMLSQSNKVFVQKSQLGGGSPMIRGFATSRVLLVVDGIRMNNAIFREGNVQNVISLDPLSMQRSEIIFGPGSVIYGSDALGGVMNFTSLKPQFAYGDELRINASAVLRAATANNERTTHIDFNLGGKRFSSYTSITGSYFGDLEMGTQGLDEYQRKHFQISGDSGDFTADNPNPDMQLGSGYEQFYAMQKFKYQANDNVTWELDYHFSRLSRVARYDRLIEYNGSELKYGEWYYGPQTWQMARLGYTFTEPVGIFDKLKFTGAYQNFGESRHNRLFNDPTRRNNIERVQAYSANFDFQKILTTKSRIFYGLEAVLNEVGSSAYSENIHSGATAPMQSRYPDGSTWASYSAYVTWTHEFANRVTFSTGARYSKILINARFDTSFVSLPFETSHTDTDALTGSAGLAKEYGAGSRVYLNLGTGFRAPNIDDIGKFTDPEPNTVSIPNPDLASEYLYSGEIGVQHRIGESYELDVVLFYNYLTNAIVRRPATLNGSDSIVMNGVLHQVVTLKNADFATVYGVSASMKANFTRNFNGAVSANYTYGEDAEGLALRHAAPLFGHFSLGYNYGRFRGQFYITYNGEIAAADLAPSEWNKVIYAKDENGNNYSPEWYTLNLKGSFRINEYIQVNAGVENILDVRYRPYSSGIVAPGRNFIVALRAEI